VSGSLASFDPSQWYMLVHVAMAMVLGAVLGLEREWAHKPAGLRRTHMLVAAAASLIVSMGDVVVEGMDREITGIEVNTDPLRLVEAVIAGISFLGAGTIIRHTDEGSVEGITTAASLLLTAAIGVCTALSQVVAATGTTLIVFVTLHVIGRIGARRVALASTSDHERSAS